MKALIHSILCALFLSCICSTNLSAQSVDEGKNYYSNPKMGIIPNAPKAYQDTSVVNKSDDLIIELVGEGPDTTTVDTSKGSFDKDNYYDYEYTARINRFHRSMGFGYFDPWYTDLYWFTGDSLDCGISIYYCWNPWYWNSWHWDPWYWNHWYWDPWYWDNWYWYGYGYYYPYYYGWGGYAWAAPPLDPGYGHHYINNSRTNSNTPTHRTAVAGKGATTRYAKPESVSRQRTSQVVTRNNGRNNSNGGAYRNAQNNQFNSGRYDNSRNNSRNFDNSRTNTRTSDSYRTNTRTFDNNRPSRNTGSFNTGSSFRGSSMSTGRSGGFGGGAAPRRR